MPRKELNQGATCLNCVASLTFGAGECWLCGLSVEQTAEVERPSTTAQPGFGLSVLMLMIALIVVCLGVFLVAPGIGILVVIVLMPVLLRFWRTASQRDATDQPKSRIDRASSSLKSTSLSLGAVVTIGVSAFVAFFRFCFAGGWAGFIGGALLDDFLGVTGGEYAWAGPGIFVGGTVLGILGAYSGARVCYRIIRRFRSRKE